MLPDNFANLSQAQKDQYFSTGKVGAVAGTNTMGASILTPTINSTTLSQQPSVVIPPKPAPQNLAPAVAGGNATIQANSQSLSTPATPAPVTQTDTTTQAPEQNAFQKIAADAKAMLYSKLGVIPQAAPAPVKQTADIAPVSAAAQDQQVAQDALNLAQNKVAGINAEIQALDAQSKADALSLEGQGRGIDATILSRQASEISRQAAIKAIPLQVKALAAQGEVLATQAQVAAAQGKTQMAQFLYDNAQKQLDNAYTAQVANWQQNQEYQNKYFDTLSKFMDSQQQASLEAIKAQKTQISNFNKDLFDKAYASAVANKDISAQSKLIAAMKDPNDPNVANTLSAINAGIRQTGGGSKILSVTEAQALGVPYGTTEQQAIAMGKTPQKAATATQETTALYANRLEQSNSILSKLDNDIAGMNPLSYKTQQNLPQIANSLKSSNFQSIEQAQRNFVNATLRRESGASISPSEFESATKQYFALPGDSPSTVAQKKANRDLVQQGFVSGAGSAYTPLITAQTTTKSGKTFDVAAAKASGYTQAEIDTYLNTH